MAGDRPRQPDGGQRSLQPLQVVLQPDGAAVHDLDHLVDAVAQLEAAVFDADPALGERAGRSRSNRAAQHPSANLTFMIIYRPAAPADLAQVLSLLREIMEHHGVDPSGGRRSGRQRLLPSSPPPTTCSWWPSKTAG